MCACCPTRRLFSSARVTRSKRDANLPAARNQFISLSLHITRLLIIWNFRRFYHPFLLDGIMRSFRRLITMRFSAAEYLLHSKWHVALYTLHAFYERNENIRMSGSRVSQSLCFFINLDYSVREQYSKSSTS